MTQQSEVKQTAADEQHGYRDDELEQALLIALFTLWYGTVMRAVHTLFLTALNLGPVPLDDPSVRQIVLAGQASAVAIDATTRRAIAQRIADGLQQGLDARQIASGTDTFPGIDGLFEDTWAHRSETIAKTELQKAQLLATKQRAQTIGRGMVTGLLAHDGDYDAACAERDGRIYAVNNAPDLLHPNCRLTLSPVVFGQA